MPHVNRFEHLRHFQGLGDRQVVSHDRRQALLALTAQGCQLHANMLPRVAAINSAVLAQLTDDATARDKG